MHFTLGELLLDLVQNAANAGAQTVRVSVREGNGRFAMTVSDDGAGMSPRDVRRATDPFFTDRRSHPDRGVGLGLAFLGQTAEATDGSFRLQSKVGEGTIVGIDCPAGHVDLPPLGDPVETFVAVLCTERVGEIEISRDAGESAYTLRKSELNEVLGDLSSVEARGLLREYVRSQEEEIWRR